MGTDVNATLLHWVCFFAGVLGLLCVDLLVLNRGSHEVKPAQALRQTAVWVSLAAAFGVWIGVRFGWGAASDFTAGYLLEEALSIDNLVVMMVLLSFFRVPRAMQHRVLFWGILGALVLRLVFILGGTALLHHGRWLMYVFGVILVFSGIKLLRHDEEDDPSQSWLVKGLRQAVRTTPDFVDDHFFVVRDGVRYATPLFLALLCVEGSDVIFAVDSIPAVFGVTRDPFIVFTSNVCAVLGLRSLYFSIAGAMDRFEHLPKALAIVLLFIGAKMLLAHWWHPPTWVSLVVIVVMVGGAMITSTIAANRREAESEAAPAEPPPEAKQEAPAK